MNVKKRWLLVAGVAAAATVLVVVALLVFGKRHKPLLLPGPTAGEHPALEQPAGTSLPVTLLFYSESSSLLIPVRAQLGTFEVREDLYSHFLDLLFKGDGRHIVPLPEGTAVQSLFFLKDAGLLVIDFNENLINLFPGGTSAELEFIYFLVDNLCFNFQEIKRVKVLVAGNEIKSLAGHLDMENAFYPNFSLIQQ